MPEPLIRAGGILKQAAAIVNAEVIPHGDISVDC